ncbi:MAG: DUF1062 domain-containing protein [Clostridiales bacterium]|nr:DUF1062 domain-containing protein [Clostridiales bacterium]
MEKKTWEIQVLSPPHILKYCKKCGKKVEFTCSGQFRINAQRRYLDIWLIYKCFNCNATWNATVFSRISPQSIPAELLDGFHSNDEALAERYAMDIAFLRGNGVEVEPPKYSVIGDSFSPNEAVELEIKTEYSLPVKVSSLIRAKLHLSQKEYSQLAASGIIQSIPTQDLQKCRLNDGITLIFNGSPPHLW